MEDLQIGLNYPYIFMALVGIAIFFIILNRNTKKTPAELDGNFGKVKISRFFAFLCLGMGLPIILFSGYFILYVFDLFELIVSIICFMVGALFILISTIIFNGKLDIRWSDDYVVFPTKHSSFSFLKIKQVPWSQFVDCRTIGEGPKRSIFLFLSDNAYLHFTKAYVGWPAFINAVKSNRPDLYAAGDLVNFDELW